MQQVLMGTHRQARGRRTKQRYWEHWGRGWGRGNQATKQRPQTPSLGARRSWPPCLVPLWRHLTSPPGAPLDTPQRLCEAFRAGWKWSLSLHCRIFWKSLLEGGLSKMLLISASFTPGRDSRFHTLSCFIRWGESREESRKGKTETVLFFQWPGCPEKRDWLWLSSFLRVWGPTSCVFTASPSPTFSQLLVASYLELLEGSPFFPSHPLPNTGRNSPGYLSGHPFPEERLCMSLCMTLCFLQKRGSESSARWQTPSCYGPTSLSSSSAIFHQPLPCPLVSQGYFFFCEHGTASWKNTSHSVKPNAFTSMKEISLMLSLYTMGWLS